MVGRTMGKSRNVQLKWGEVRRLCWKQGMTVMAWGESIIMKGRLWMTGVTLGKLWEKDLKKEILIMWGEAWGVPLGLISWGRVEGFQKMLQLMHWKC